MRGGLPALGELLAQSIQMPTKEDVTDTHARDTMVAYLLLKVAQKDWHGVSDAANDLREMEAVDERRVLCQAR